MENVKRLLPVMALASMIAGIAGIAGLQACSSPQNIGPAQPEHGPMGSTSTGSRADLPSRNSESLPIDRPE